MLMADSTLPNPDPQAYTNFIRAAGKALHAKDQPPATRQVWLERRTKLRAAMFDAMGPFPDKPCSLEPKVIGVLKRPGYWIEMLIFQSRPDVWVTASAYVPENVPGKAPAVLVVHGHWPLARRDPVVARGNSGLDRHPWLRSALLRIAIYRCSLAGLTEYECCGLR